MSSPAPPSPASIEKAAATEVKGAVSLVDMVIAYLKTHTVTALVVGVLSQAAALLLHV